ncbi:MAG TPA: F0F1 ATP synthase subunit B [Firmicutes bacterium]|nr:F0F1 ATP synthase subunit B [Bacillota bacterium]
MPPATEVSLFHLPTYIFQLINFLVLYLVLRHVFFGPVSQYLERRRRHIADSLKSAEDKLREAEKSRADLASEVEAARRRAREIVSEAGAVARDLKDKALAKARDEAEAMVSRARDQVEAEIASARDRLKSQALEVALALAGRILEREIKPEDDQRLIDEVTARLEERNQEMGEAPK